MASRLQTRARTMRTLQTTVRADERGVLHLELPVGASGAEFDIVVVVQPGLPDPVDRRSDDLGWPVNFFEETAGVWLGDLDRVQVDFERRDQR